MAPEEFIKQINGKHIAAFRELFSVFYRYLVLYAMRLVRQQEVAEDMVQEVFVAIWESDKEYNSYHGFRAFLYDSVKNKCLNYLKHEEVERRHAELMMRYVEEDDEDYRVMREEMYRELHRAVDELPDRCRAVFELHLQRKKNEEIAQLLKLSVETVKTQKKKAMHTLRERLGKLFDILVALNIV
ncbi:RNA polymerase sigma-70 factor [Butyricimonas hominis]|uniref:RNA polymerase sigma-70 factor n=1 Tax=Butyricimonas TaxID=574697 RepID=UPI003511DE14